MDLSGIIYSPYSMNKNIVKKEQKAEMNAREELLVRRRMRRRMILIRELILSVQQENDINPMLRIRIIS